jgi:hypothetical protein
MRRSIPLTILLSTLRLFAQQGEKLSSFEKRMGEMHDSSERSGWSLIEGHLPDADSQEIIESILKAIDSPNTSEFRNYLRTNLHFKAFPFSTKDSKQVLVVVPESMCVPTGICSMLVFVRIKRHLRLVLEAMGTAFYIQKETSLGFHDFATYVHGSASTGAFTIYHWNGDKYRLSGCFAAESDKVSQTKCWDRK